MLFLLFNPFKSTIETFRGGKAKKRIRKEKESQIEMGKIFRNCVQKNFERFS